METDSALVRAGNERFGHLKPPGLLIATDCTVTTCDRKCNFNIGSSSQDFQRLKLLTKLFSSKQRPERDYK